METITLVTNGIGKNEFWELRDQLNTFVKDNFELLYEGAVRCKLDIGADYYAPERVQINRTRLHYYVGLKYAAGHKYNDEWSPTEEQLRETVGDLQTLLDAASEEIKAPFVISIIEKEALTDEK